MTTHTPSKRLLVCLVAATVALAPLLVGAGAAATAPDATERVEQLQTDGELTLEVTEQTNDTVTVTLSTTVENVAGYQTHLTFDPEATAVESVEGGEGAFGADPVQTIDNKNGSVNFNQIAEGAPDTAVDSPTMATITFETPDTPTEISFVAGDSLVATGDLEDVTDLTRNGVTLSSDGSGSGDGGDGSDGGDGGDGSDGSDGEDGSDGSDGEDGSDGSDGEDGSDDSDDGDGEDGSDSSGGSDGSDDGDESDAGGPVVEEQAPGFGPLLTLIALLGSALAFGRLNR